MPNTSRQPVLHLVTCGTKPASDLEPFIKTCQELGWDIHVIATPSAARVIDKAYLAELTGHPVHEDDQPEPLYPLPPACALAVAPATFNTINKWAYGHNDNLALRLLNEATGLCLPIVVVPIPDAALARHPAFTESVARLRRWGVSVVFDPTLDHQPDHAVNPFIWQAAERVVAEWTRFTRLPATDPCEPTDPPEAADPYEPMNSYEPVDSYGTATESYEVGHPGDDIAIPYEDGEPVPAYAEPPGRHAEQLYHYSSTR